MGLHNRGPYFKKKRRLGKGLQRFNAERRVKKGEIQKVSIDNKTEGEFILSGRRIVKIQDFINQIRELDNHSPCGCSFKDMLPVGERRKGLNCGIIFKCCMCNLSRTVWSEMYEDNKMDINTCAVSGTVATGGGHAQLEEMLSAMNIPPMTDKTFTKYETVVANGWMATAQDEMTKAAAEEARLSVQHGEIDKDGTPLITVVADGSWCKRSYRSNYSSLSGVAAIVGHRTKQVLYIGVKNKYCTPCARAETAGETPKEHNCFKNWSLGQSSSSMEAAIIVEGFLNSEAMYGVRYSRMIADGDSSVYKKILDHRPYKTLTVEKVECKNHLLRNFSNKLKQLAATSTRGKNTICLRKKIGSSILRCRTAVSKATAHRKQEDKNDSEKIQSLKMDILNIPSHVFGEHKHCKARGYFCELDVSSAPSENNFVPELINSGLYQQICDIVKDLSRHSRSLICDVTSNTVEHYNSLIAKFIGGKRINFAMRGSYQGRCSAAVVQHNTGSIHYNLHKTLYNSSPGLFTKSTENKRKRKKDHQKTRKRSRKALFSDKKCNEHYGPLAQRPDLEPELMETEIKDFLSNLKKTREEIDVIEQQTVNQSDSSKWLEIRRNLLTASNFGRVCKMKPTTGCDSLVKEMLYSNFDCDAMKYGRKNEDIARQEISSELGVAIKKCGLFICEEYPFLGASPDGLIDKDGLIEIKCPASCKDITPEEAITLKKFPFFKINKEGKIEVQKNHSFYYQIQGQLHITRRDYCLFVLWTPKGKLTETIVKDDSFWCSAMVDKLVKFYNNCVLPELVDPRHTRSMPIRNPGYIQDAKRKSKKSTSSME